MKSIIAVIFGLCLLSCNFQEHKKGALDKHVNDSLKTDSIKRTFVEDSTLISGFKKWVSSNSRNTTFIHPLFVPDINLERSTDLNFVILKNKLSALSAIVKKEDNEQYKLGYSIRNDITRTNFTDFSTKDIDLYKTGMTYFQLVVTSDNRTDTTTFKEVSADNLLKAISSHVKDKIKVEEYFERREIGHFEGGKKPKDLNVRSLVLSEDNKKALQESYRLSLILDKGNSVILK